MEKKDADKKARYGIKNPWNKKAIVINKQ